MKRGERLPAHFGKIGKPSGKQANPFTGVATPNDSETDAKAGKSELRRLSFRRQEMRKQLVILVI